MRDFCYSLLRVFEGLFGFEDKLSPGEQRCLTLRNLDDREEKLTEQDIVELGLTEAEIIDIECMQSSREKEREAEKMGRKHYAIASVRLPSGRTRDVWLYRD
jgi:hypothetical protein